MDRDTDIGKPTKIDEEEVQATLSELVTVQELVTASIAARASSLGKPKKATIAIGDTISNAVDLGGNYARLLIEIPAIISAQLELQVAVSLGGTYQDFGQNALTTLGTGGYNDTWVLGGWRFIKIKASAAQTTYARVFEIRGITY